MSLLNKELIIVDDLIVKIPTCEEIRGTSWDFGKDTDEIDYFSIVRIFTTNPSSMMVELDDIKIDYETLKDFELFLLLFRSLDKNTLAKIAIRKVNFTVFIDTFFLTLITSKH